MIKRRFDLDVLRADKVGSNEVSGSGGCSTAIQVRKRFWIGKVDLDFGGFDSVRSNHGNGSESRQDGNREDWWRDLRSMGINKKIRLLLALLKEGGFRRFTSRGYNIYLPLASHRRYHRKDYQDLLSLVMEGLRGMTQGQWLSKYEGKKVVAAKPSLKITVPRFDNSEIIASYGKTLIGRCMNPQKQDMKILLFMMPKIWQVEGRVAGTDLGLGRFQFDFDMEEDITEVLKMEPFHFDYWMVSLEITSEEGVMEGTAVFGATATSYKAAVASTREPGGERIDGERNDGKPVHFQSSRDGNKGKGIVREKPGPYRQEGSYHAYRERLPRGNGEGSSFRGRQYGYPSRRYEGQYQGIQRSRNDAGDGRLHVDNPEKLMLDAFKGLNRSSNEGDTKQGIMVGSETASKARKALLFEESSGVDENKGSDGVAVKALSKETVVMEGVQAQRVPEGVMTDATHLEDKEVSQALDDANLMVEGVILSDSELMVDEEFGDTQEWEEGEIELMEEEVDAEQEVAAEEQGEIDQVKGEEDFEKEKQAKKKMTKPGALALGVSTKSRLVQNLISPRKKVSTKAPAKGGGKGAGPSKKESSKP
ncbi:hypothetical protein Bca101_044845 [Brassica carinata]